jgi:hypothetical protein
MAIVPILLHLLSREYLNAQRTGGTLFGTETARDALDGFDMVRVVIHGQGWAKAHTGEAADTVRFLQAHHTGFVPVEGTCRADLNAVAALGTDCHTPFGVSQAGDTDRRFVTNDLFVPGLGADIFTKMAADAELVVCDQNLHFSSPFHQIA